MNAIEEFFFGPTYSYHVIRNSKAVWPNCGKGQYCTNEMEAIEKMRDMHYEDHANKVYDAKYEIWRGNIKAHDGRITVVKESMKQIA
jgi:hypothetical protein